MSLASFFFFSVPLITGAVGESPVAKHGRLGVSGNKVCDQHGQAVQLRGMSLFWSQWSVGSKFYNRDAIRHLVNDWHVTVVRAAIGIEPDGYLVNPAREKDRLAAVVDAAIEFGIYVIIDWHDHYAEQHIPEAKEFFREMAQKYGGSPNVIFETFNEPVNQPWGSVIKPYHEQLVAEIRAHSNNLIVLGTKTYSQDVDEASWNQVAGDNLAYTLHFYANTHRGYLRNKATTALNNGIAIFVTEWGTCSADGNGQLDLNEAQVWLDFLKQHSISDANWAIGDKNEACAALKPGTSAYGGWDSSSLTTSGAWVRNSIRASTTAGCSQANTNRYYPDLGGCCSGLVECKEARPKSDSSYCAVGSAGHGSTCWSEIDMCRSSCTSSPTPSTTQSPSTCSKVNTNRYYPDLGGCCSGLVECKEARPKSDSSYCAVGSAGHGSTCWSEIDMCRSSCTSSPAPTPSTTKSPSTCSKVNTNRYSPDLGGCCSGLRECKEARPKSDSAYCAVGSAGHGSSCWSEIDMCRNSCGPSPTPSPPTPSPPSGPCQSVWNNEADGHTCGVRIQWLRKSRGMSETEAKDLVSGEYPHECGACGDGLPCNDKMLFCGWWQRLGYCQGYWKGSMKYYCSRSCGYCTSTPGGQDQESRQEIVPTAENSTSLLEDFGTIWDGLDSTTSQPAEPGQTEGFLKALAMSSSREESLGWLLPAMWAGIVMHNLL